jgi:F420-dependent oxidoreductase-like protein
MQRTGVQLGSREGTLRNGVRDFAGRAEELGFETVWVGESWGHEAFTLLSHMAAVTERIQLGTGIVNVFSRSPALVAQTVASLDELSEGRAILGLGTSGANVVEQWHGIPYQRPVERMKEYVEIVRLILRGERLEYHSGLFDLQRGFRLPFKPHRQEVPIYLATLAGRSLRLTGELADGWLPIYFWPERFEQLTAPIREGARATGRDFGVIAVAPYILTAVTPDGDEARSLMRAHIAYYIGGMGVYYHKLWHTYGFPEEADAVRAAWAAGDRAGAAAKVTDAMVRAVTISGTRKECLQRLEEYRAHGVQAPVLSMPHGVSHQIARETLAALAPATLG